MKRGIIVAVIAIVLAAVLGVLFWNIMEPGVPDYAKEECKGDPSDYDNCIEREKIIEACFDIENEEKQIECLDNSTTDSLEDPEVEITTGPISE